MPRVRAIGLAFSITLVACSTGSIGFASIATNHAAAGPVVWLTSTPGLNEADSALVRWQPSDDATEQFLVGWLAPSPPLLTCWRA